MIVVNDGLVFAKTGYIDSGTSLTQLRLTLLITTPLPFLAYCTSTSLATSHPVKAWQSLFCQQVDYNESEQNFVKQKITFLSLR